MSKHVIVGAGIIGLYTGYVLIQRGETDVTIVAEHLPGDQSTYYTSPWAGGNFSAISAADADTLAFDKFTYTNLQSIQKTLGGPECGLQQFPTTEYWDFLPSKEKLRHLSTYLQDFQVLPSDLLPIGAQVGVKYTTWDFNCPKFLVNLAQWLQNQGVKFERKKLSHISQAFASSDTKYVFNCTGIGARTLEGVKDSKVYPTRGQVVVIRAPHIKENMHRWGKNYATYIIPRPHSDHQVILGGFLQKDNWTGDTFGYETKDIIERTTTLLPQILDKPLEILREAAGLRPSRQGGTRIEKENVGLDSFIVHNYGASGNGYQSGLGMAMKAVQLAFDEADGELNAISSSNSKL